MPYISQENREKFKMIEDDVIAHLVHLDLGAFVGHLNYHVFRIVKKYIQFHGKKYFTFCAIVGTLICCILEIYRRLVVRYEDSKIEINGDVE